MSSARVGGFRTGNPYVNTILITSQKQLTEGVMPAMTETMFDKESGEDMWGSGYCIWI